MDFQRAKQNLSLYIHSNIYSSKHLCVYMLSSFCTALVKVMISSPIILFLRSSPDLLDKIIEHLKLYNGLSKTELLENIIKYLLKWQNPYKAFIVAETLEINFTIKLVKWAFLSSWVFDKEKLVFVKA